MATGNENQGGSEPGVEVWRGGVNAWECDEMGHLNVRFYVARAMEGLAGLAAGLGLPRAFTAAANATLMLRDLHIRFLREARVAAPLHMRGWVVEIGDSAARLMLVLYHSRTLEPAATFQLLVEHVTPREGRVFAWPELMQERAAALTAPVPSFGAPRSVDLAPVKSQASVERADGLGLTTVANGAVSPQDCDVFGRMRPDHFLGRVSESVSILAGPIRRIAAGPGYAPERIGGVMLEYRLIYLDWPRAGEPVVIRSGLAEVGPRTQNMVHWLLNPSTGRPWATAKAVAASFDLEQRKAIPVSPDAQAALQPFIIPGLTL
jgi:acyl-CoA thioester hydrolase